MRRAVYCLLLTASLATLLAADEPVAFRGQTATEWLKQLSHPSPSARAAAAQAFVSMGQGSEEAVERLITLLADRDERVRFYAAYALGKIDARPAPCMAALTEALPDTDEHVRYAAQWALAQIAQRTGGSGDESPPADDSLSELLKQAETQLMVTGALPGHLRQVRAALARLDRSAAEQAQLRPPVNELSDEADEIDRCLEAITSEDLTTKVKAFEDLLQHGIPGLERLLASPDVVSSLGPISWHLSVRIADLGEPTARILFPALQNSHDATSELAACALMELGPAARGILPDAVKLLETEHTPGAIRLRVIGMLSSMGPAAASSVDCLMQVLSDPEQDESFQASAAEAIGAMGPPAKRSVPVLIDRLSQIDASSYLHSEILSALVQIAPGSDEVLQALVRALEESDNVYDVIEIAERLCQCGAGAGQIVPRLCAAVEETSFDERAALLRLLGELGSAQADELCPLLFARLMDPQEELMVQVAAAQALGKLGPLGVCPLVEALRDGDRNQQLLAARAFVEIGSAALPGRDVLHDTLCDATADNELRALAAVALGQLGSDARPAAPALEELCNASAADNYLRAMCAIALAQIDPAAVTVLEARLADSEPEVQIAAAYAICKIAPQHPQGLGRLVLWLESEEYRPSAMAALIDIGEPALECVVGVMHDTSKDRETRLACLEVVSTCGDPAVSPLLHALNDETIADESGWALRDRGNKLLPTLVASMQDERNFTLRARTMMSSVLEDLLSGLGAGGEEITWQGGHPLVQRADADSLAWDAMEIGTPFPEMASAPLESEMAESDVAEFANSGGAAAMAVPPIPEAIADTKSSSDVDVDSDTATSLPVPAGYKTVDVFYGTNRRPINENQGATNGPSGRWMASAGLGVLASVIVLIGLYRRGAWWPAVGGLAALILVLLLGLFLLVPIIVSSPVEKSGPRYGGEYSEHVELGVCQVTIPDTHREGALEAPTLLRFQVAEDPQKHIVLRSVRRVPSDAFFAGLQKEMHARGNHILVFVHGYNVSFEDAARRTAQMASDLKFAGAPIFYSWPSQADWWKYRLDEKNVELSVDQLKTFLLELAERSGADTINLVAHSMGSRALTDALKEMDVAATAQRQLFNQVILAAPDIDADVFKQRIAPAIVNKARHITLYASSKDLALVASRTFNSGDPRAGDAGEDLVVFPGIETIDVSSGDSSLLGHSYYGDNASVLGDIEFLLRDHPASSRRFLEPVHVQEDLIYWRFQPTRISRRSDANSETH